MPNARKWNKLKLDHPVIRQSVFWGFFALVLVGGGASRADALSLIYLRPIAVLVLAYALWIRLEEKQRKLGAPFWLTAAVGLLVLAQLVPLPPGLWTSLPGREPIVAVHAAAGIPLSWRPLTLAPAASWNGLFSLTIPLAIMAAYAIQPEKVRRNVPLALVCAGMLSMAWGLMQLAGGTDSVLYHYRIHTDGRAVGLFANRNHNAMFIALTVLAAAVFMTRLEYRRAGWSLGVTLFAGYMVLAVPFVLILGSRAGLAMSVMAVAIAIFAVIRSGAGGDGTAAAKPGLKGRVMALLRSRLALAAAGIGSLFAVGAFAVVSNRGEAFTRLSDGGIDSGIGRADIFPFLGRMIGDQFPWGSGFGSFSEVFQQYENTQMLSNFYLNQAHNDWAQILIEGGVPAAAILLCFLGWLAMRARDIYLADNLHAGAARSCLVAMFVLIGFGSMVDYPLRVPIIAMTLALAAMLLNEPAGFFQQLRNARPHR